LIELFNQNNSSEIEEDDDNQQQKDKINWFYVEKEDSNIIYLTLNWFIFVAIINCWIN